jgi:hypothetical protein
MLPIDPDRSTHWALLELLYCLTRDLARATRGVGSRRSVRRISWIAGLIVASSGGAIADGRFHLLRLFLRAFS